MSDLSPQSGPNRTLVEDFAREKRTYPWFTSQQAGAGVLLENFSVSHVAAQRLDRAVPALVHHLLGRRQARGVKLGGPRLAAARKAFIALLSPEIPKPIRGQLGVTHRVLDVLVAEPSL